MGDFTVLLIDEEKTYLEALENKLVRQGLDIRRADGAEKALSEIGTKEIDVVLLDVMMPGVDGIELLKQIKALDPLVEVILLAGQATLSVAIQGMELGAFDFLVKTIDADELIYKLRDAYEKKALQQEKIVRVRNAITQKAQEE